MNRARILVVDDHPIVILGLKILLEDNKTYKICGEADSISETYEKINSLDPSIIILDLLLGPADGVNIIHEILRIKSNAKIIIYSCHHEHLVGSRAMRAGAHGYVSKVDGLPQIEKALEAVHSGQLFFQGAVRQDRDFLPPDDARRALPALSGREIQVLRLTGQGLSLQRIAKELGLSTKTIGTYRERLKIKLGVDRVQELLWLSQDLLAQNLIGPGAEE